MGSSFKMYAIKNGPSRDHLFHAVEYALDDNVDFNVSFTCIEKGTDSNEQIVIKPTKIISISHGQIFENDANRGQSFIIKGYCASDSVPFHFEESIADAYGFVAEYCTQNRTGSLEFNSEMSLMLGYL